MKIVDGKWDYNKKDLLELKKRYRKNVKDRMEAGWLTPRPVEDYHLEDSQTLHHNINEFIYKLQYDYEIDPMSLSDEEFILMYEMDFGELNKYEYEEFKMMEKAGNLIEKGILRKDEIERIKKYLRDKDE